MKRISTILRRIAQMASNGEKVEETAAMEIHDCIYPDCQIKGEWLGTACEHSCEYEEKMKREKPHWRDCLATEVHGSCQFPKCDC